MHDGNARPLVFHELPGSTSRGSPHMAKGTAARPDQRDTVLARIRGVLPNLTKSEGRVARQAVKDPAGTAGSTIGELARRCDTSEATVLRLCRTIGFNGYPEFRLALAVAGAATGA